MCRAVQLNAAVVAFNARVMSVTKRIKKRIDPSSVDIVDGGDASAELPPVLPVMFNDSELVMRATVSNVDDYGTEPHSISISVRTINADYPKGLRKVLDILTAEGISMHSVE
jgi:hypothetical protein